MQGILPFLYLIVLLFGPFRISPDGVAPRNEKNNPGSDFLRIGAGVRSCQAVLPCEVPAFCC